MRRGDWTTLAPAVWIGVLLAAGLSAEVPGFSRPAGGERVEPGTTIEARWTFSPAGADAGDEAEILLSLDGGRSFPLRVSREVLPESGRAIWRVPSLPSRHARLALRTGRSGEDEPESVAFVGAEFEIELTRGVAAEELFRGRSEWATRPAARDAGAAPPAPAGGWDGIPDLARLADSGSPIESGSTAVPNFRPVAAQGGRIPFRQLRKNPPSRPASPSGHFPRRE